MKEENWVWMPHGGHFILGHMCRFRLNTYVGKYIVSTVGECIPAHSTIDILKPEFKHLRGDEKEYAYLKKYQCENVGYNRKYETMVFKSRKSKHKCCPYEANVSEGEKDMEGYNTAEDAYKGHLKMCKKWEKEVKDENMQSIH